MSDWLDAEGHADRALEMFERGRWAEAESELRKALSLNPDQAEWHYNLGLTLEAAGRDHEALNCYERAISLAPDQVDPLLAAGVVSNRLLRPQAALNWLDAALAIDDRMEATHAQKIDALVRLGRHEEAETAFFMSQQLLSDPSAQCLAAVAEGLIEQEDWGRAGWCLREAMRLEPRMPRLRARLAIVLAATGKQQQALQMFLGDLRDDPGNLDTLLDYGELLVDLGRLSEAGEKFRRVLEIEPANVDAHYRLGQIAMSTDRYEQAHLEFELVLKLDATYPGVRMSVAEALLRREHVESARTMLREELDIWERDELLTREPGSNDGLSIDAWQRMGSLLLDVGMPERAAEILARVADVSRDDAALFRRLAVARFRSGDRDGGAAAARRVLRLDPRCVVSMHNLALCAMQDGRIAVAAGWVARGLRVDRHDTDLRRLRMRVWLASIIRRLREKR